MPRNGFWLLLFVMLALIIGVLIAAMNHVASAHEAPSGFLYPQDCCSNTDCHPVSCEALREVDGGVAFLSFKFTGPMIRRSEDGFCHICVGHYGPSPEQHVPHCVFLTPRV